MTEGTYRDGIRAILPLMPAIVAFGASFGVLARAAGVAIVLRAPLLVVVLVAAATAAGLRAIS